MDKEKNPEKWLKDMKRQFRAGNPVAPGQVKRCSLSPVVRDKLQQHRRSFLKCAYDKGKN